MKGIFAYLLLGW